jgi:hypothetical protein
VTPEHDPAQKLDLRLIPADGGKPDYQVFDDIARLIRQAHATAPPQAPRIGPSRGFRTPGGAEAEEAAKLVSQVQHDIEQASLKSQADVAKWAELAQQPDAADQLANESRLAAEQLVAAIGRALLRGIAVRTPDPEPTSPG